MAGNSVQACEGARDCSCRGSSGWYYSDEARGYVSARVAGARVAGAGSTDTVAGSASGTVTRQEVHPPTPHPPTLPLSVCAGSVVVDNSGVTTVPRWLLSSILNTTISPLTSVLKLKTFTSQGLHK